MADLSMRWTRELDGPTAAAVRGLLARAQSADDVAPVSEQAVLSLNSATARHLLVERAGELVGYANLVDAHDEHPAMAEVAVDPQARGRGVGAAAVAAALSEGGAGARVWAHGNLAPAKGVAARLGLATARELWQMRRALANPKLPELIVPEGLSLRAYAGPSDDAEVLRVNNAAFSWHPEQGGWSEREIAARRAESWFDPNGLFIVTETAVPDRILGFHWTKVHGAERPPVGEVYVVGIDPAEQGRGLGRLLTLAGLRHLRDRGLAEVLLYTEADNTAAVRTYTRLGFAPAHIDVAYALPEPA
ncbi:mycothiol synthase [Nocardia bovistercoris]|uniref:Mycothiol acetyltransferase n=1 Tax=Nocardia bovistercoris TaxID=2785916 RepID=A0A931N6B7_9NOCA|nr:mycothiol synthase [Nocardia bovistercoris]MBH0780592.1 mycothiol synthase [Nocardia bovistercoris]